MRITTGGHFSSSASPRFASMRPIAIAATTFSIRFGSRPMRTMRDRGDRVKIMSGKYTGHTGTVESNV